MKSVLEWRSAKTIRRAPDKIGNVNKSIPPVTKRDQGNNGIVFNERKSRRKGNSLYSLSLKL